ncbi:tetratricopeptide repeat protein [Lewinella sp. IMCC34183]|uniref:tetratricopeptide repeat protein n=1 Tax=Lewinella sp. IMCC34183 TaxID=2248762 RepID=UPI000E27D26D|nr:tetratricopeptide repeat protein [Lewinella sp. IMCC34183]
MDTEGAVARIEQLLRLEKFGAARQAVDAALRSDPEERWFLLCRAELEFLDGDRNGASRLADCLVGDYPEWCRAHYLRARIRTSVSDYAGAEAAIREALAISPYVPEYLARLSHIQLGLHEIDGAISSSEAALAYDPENVLALNVRSRALHILGRAHEAAAAYRAALRAAPDDAYNHLNFAKYLLEAGSYAGARRHFRTALRLRPGLTSARDGLISACKQEHRGYRWYLGLLRRSADPKVQGGLSSLLIVCGSMGGSVLLRTLPFGQAVRYLTFGAVVLLTVLFGFRFLGPVVSNWLLYAKPARRALLTGRTWRLTYAVSALLLVGAATTVGYLLTGTDLALAVMTYAFTLLVPAFTRWNDGPDSVPAHWLSLVLPPLALAGTVATVFHVYPEVWYAAYGLALLCLVGVLARYKPSA